MSAIFQLKELGLLPDTYFLDTWLETDEDEDLQEPDELRMYWSGVCKHSGYIRWTEDGRICYGFAAKPYELRSLWLNAIEQAIRHPKP